MATIAPNTLPGDLRLSATLDIHSKEGQAKHPTFSLVANTGKPMHLGGFFYPILLDLSGASFDKKKTPVIMDHDVAKRVGHTTNQVIDEKGIRAEGVVSSSMQIAKGFVADAKKGFPFQTSVGATIEEGEFIDTLQRLSDAKVHMIKLSAPDGTLIELLKDENHPRPSPPKLELCDRGISHVAFTVADVDAAWRTLCAEGCEVLSDPLTAPDGKARLFFARDPEGNLLEIVQVMAD